MVLCIQINMSRSEPKRTLSTLPKLHKSANAEASLGMVGSVTLVLSRDFISIEACTAVVNSHALQ